VPNRLIEAISPYLLQHADNPVDWFEWGEEAFAEALRRDVPVLLSVGYASCHWCHVMAHESFEDEATAEVMNRWFVNVKVDREERPDIDRIYMDAVQAMSGRGGWPMTVFLTPTGEPFHAGTYYPKDDRHGHPSFLRLLGAIREAWEQRRDDVVAQASTLAAAVAVAPPAASELPGEEVLAAAYRSLRTQFDPVHGGFGGAPKFPQAPTLEFLLRAVGRPWAPEAESMLTTTLEAMAAGGIHDHVGGGFARYSVDERWLVPHFEKMLYDNALLARLYLRAWQVTGVGGFADVARNTLDYALRDLLLPEGGFASGEDADSEGEEGTFYVFDWEEGREAAGSEAVAEALGITERGNFEGRSIVYQPEAIAAVAARHGLDPATLAQQVTAALSRLAVIRSQRVRPDLDDKAVASWNGLMVRALAEAGAVLGEERYLDAARTAAGFILDHLMAPDGRLQRSWRAGRTSGPAFCDDYGAVALGLFALYQSTGEAGWYHAGADLTRSMRSLFEDEQSGGFFASGSDADELIARPKNLFDNPTPSDNSLAAEALQTLAAFTGESALIDSLEGAIRSASALLDRYPSGAGQMLSVLLVALDGPVEIAIVGSPEGRRPLIDVVHRSFRPGAFVAVGDGASDEGIPLLRDRPATGGAAAYVCRGFVCDAPEMDPARLASVLG
jgi:uncharacterized protein YyaL (SSP411 family)